MKTIKSIVTFAAKNILSVAAAATGLSVLLLLAIAPSKPGVDVLVSIMGPASGCLYILSTLFERDEEEGLLDSDAL